MLSSSILRKKEEITLSQFKTFKIMG